MVESCVLSFQSLISRIPHLLRSSGRVPPDDDPKMKRPPLRCWQSADRADARPSGFAVLSLNNFFFCPPLSGHDIHEVTDLLIDVVGFRHGLRDLFADDFGLTPSKPEKS